MSSRFAKVLTFCVQSCRLFVGELQKLEVLKFAEKWLLQSKQTIC